MTKPASEKQIEFMNRLGIEVPVNCTMDVARYLIEQKKGSSPQDFTKSEKYSKPEVKASPANLNAMYTSYAKDIFVCFASNPNFDNKKANDVMELAIAMVRLARENL